MLLGLVGRAAPWVIKKGASTLANLGLIYPFLPEQTQDDVADALRSGVETVGEFTEGVSEDFIRQYRRQMGLDTGSTTEGEPDTPAFPPLETRPDVDTGYTRYNPDTGQFEPILEQGPPKELMNVGAGQTNIADVGPPAPSDVGPPVIPSTDQLQPINVTADRITPTMPDSYYQGILSNIQSQEQPLGKRGAGILSNIADVFGMKDPNFQDKLVMGLGGLTMNNDPRTNPLTAQAMANIANREAIRQSLMEQAMQPQEMSDEQREWLTNERYYVQSKLNSLEGVLGLLEGGSDMISGPIVNSMRRIPFFGDIADGFIFQDAARVQQGVEQVLSENLRDILGGQFAQLEGFKYLERGYNPNLDEEENARRVRDLYNTIKRAYEAKEASLNPAYTGPTFEEIIADANQNYRRNYSWSDLEMRDELEAEGITRSQWNALPQENKDAFMDQYYIDLAKSYNLM
jgi:hypothetical protein